MRHGQPELDLDSIKKTKISPCRLGELVKQYEQIALNKTIKPCSHSIEVAKHSNLFISSDLPRAISPVKMLCDEADFIKDELFKESSMPYLNWSKPSASFFTWAVTFRVLWLLGFAKNGESIKDVKNRAGLAANKLQSCAQDKGSVLLLGHGIMNRLIALKLR